MEYTGKDYKFNSAEMMNDEYVKMIKTELASLGYLSKKSISSFFDITTENAVKDFQKENSIEPTGIVDKKTWEKLFEKNDTVENIIKTTEEANKECNFGINNNDAFFKREKTFMDNSTIVISIGENIVKTITGVVFRSKSNVIQSDGTPIKEVYSFIAKDLTECKE